MWDVPWSLVQSRSSCRHVHTVLSVGSGALGDAAEWGISNALVFTSLPSWHNSDQKQAGSTAHVLWDSYMRPSAWASWLAAPIVVPKEF